MLSRQARSAGDGAKRKLQISSVLSTEERINHFGLNFITNRTVRGFFKNSLKELKKS